LIFLDTCSPSCVNGAVCQGPNTCSCHVCAGSSYSLSCYGCSFSNGGCTLSCTCNDASGNPVSTSITMSTGYGNGCLLSNNNGHLVVGGLCSWWKG
jgi:hypothetical protein